MTNAADGSQPAGRSRRRDRSGLVAGLRGCAGRMAFSLTLSAVRRPVLRVPAHHGLDLLQRRIIPQFTGDEVVGMVQALSARDVACCLAGGWGVDALVGTALPFHRDLDLVLPRFDRDVEAAVSALTSLGYEAAEPHAAGLWMPRALPFRDSTGRCVELLDLDREVVAEGLEFLAADQGPPRPGPDYFTQGTLAGRAVPCLTRDVQLVLHSGYSLRPEDHRTLRRLGWKGSGLGRWYDGPIPPIRPGAISAAGQQAPKLVLPVLEAGSGLLGVVHRRLTSAPPHIPLGRLPMPVSRIDGPLMESLSAMAGRLPRFRFSLAEVCRPGGRDVALLPVPADPFLAMRVAFGLPAGDPLQLSIADRRGPILRAGALYLSGRAVPVESQAREVWLVTDGDGGHQELIRAFRLGREPRPEPL